MRESNSGDESFMGRLTTHILDTANGRPGAGILVRLYRGTEQRELVCETYSNADGRCDEPLLDSGNFSAGTYELVFFVAEYFSATTASSETPFLDEITLRVTLSENQHYHVPLLVSPWSYSTYRGS